jgi:predicted nucleotidyltransferase
MAKDIRHLGLPESVSTSLEKLKNDLILAGGSNIAGLLLYGGIARGRYVSGRSDVNLLILLNDTSLEALDAVAPILSAAWRQLRVEPLLLSPHEVAVAAEAFPTKFLDIKNYHLVLHGEAPFASLEVPQERVRVRVGQELQNLSLRLRRRFISISENEGELTLALSEIARPLAVQLGALLAVNGNEVPDEDRTATIFSLAATQFGFDSQTLSRLAALRQQTNAEVDAKTLYGDVLATLEQIVSRVNQWKESR